jgi:hypothetical protein
MVTNRGSYGSELARKCHEQCDLYHCVIPHETGRDRLIASNHMNTLCEQRPWIEPYRLALMETNASKMPDRIETAKAAVKSRIDELGRSADGAAERVVLMDAMNALRFLTQESTVEKLRRSPRVA